MVREVDQQPIGESARDERLDFEGSFQRCRKLIRQPFGIDNFRLDATSKTAFPPQLFLDPLDEKVLVTPYEKTWNGFFSTCITKSCTCVCRKRVSTP